MHRLTAAIAVVALSSAVTAQQPGARTQAPEKLFASASDVSAMIARAKSERKPDQANFAQPLLQLAPLNANLEYRVGGLNANASVHEREAEMFYVVEGSGTLVTGGKLRDEKRTNPENLQGSGIEGGMRRRVSKGDFVMVPENTPHWFGEIDGTLVLMSLHLPHQGAGATR